MKESAVTRGAAGAPTSEQIEAALQQEFHVKPTEEGFKRWDIPVGLRFEIPGPLIIRASTDVSGVSYDDDLCISVELGGLQLQTSHAGAEATAFALLAELYGKEWARLLMALSSRCPVDYECREPSVPQEVAQALWKAAYSYRAQWPDRSTGFNDHIWGCAIPKGVVAKLPAEPKY